jgi:hypothetical protein
MHSISNRNFEIHIFASLTSRRKFQDVTRGDSAPVVNQVDKMWKRTNEKMDAYCAEIRNLEGKLFGIEFR